MDRDLLLAWVTPSFSNKMVGWVLVMESVQMMLKFWLWGAVFLMPTAVLAQSGNQSDITGVDIIEIPAFGRVATPVSAILRSSFESQLQQSSPSVGLQIAEEFQAQALQDYAGLELQGETPTATVIARMLYEAWKETGEKTAFVSYAVLADRLQIYLVLPSLVGRSTENVSIEGVPEQFNSQNPIIVERDEFVSRYTLMDVSRNQVVDRTRLFRQRILQESPQAQLLGQELYQWLMAPIADTLEAEEIETIVFSLDNGLRGLPLGALYDGQTFLLETYAIAIVPSFGLTDVGFEDIRGAQTLSVGASIFTDQVPLPAVPVEIATIQTNWSGKALLDRDFTVNNLIAQVTHSTQNLSIVHMATHGEFRPGTPEDAYIQFSDRRVSLAEFRQLGEQFGWNTIDQAPELLVLSACRTALGDDSAELGFAGLAVQSGAKSALASLWYVSDLGTLALMSEFYQILRTTPIKSQALRQAQVNLLTGKTRIENGQLVLANGDVIALPTVLALLGNVALSNPYYWSGFMLIGNWN